MKTKMTKANFTAAHKFFLRYFIRPSNIDDVSRRNPNLGSSLGEDPKETCKKFITDGLLISASLQEKLSTLTVSELQPILENMGLPIEGAKEDLVIRVLSVEGIDVAAKVANIELFVCSEKGRRLIDDQIGNTHSEAKPFNGIKKIASWLDEKGATGNMIYDILKFIGVSVFWWTVNNKITLMKWINNMWMNAKVSVRKFINFIYYEIGRRIRK